MRWILYFLLFVFFASCVKKNEKAYIGELKHPDELLNYALFNTSMEKLVSFPVLFNSKILKKDGIQSVERYFYIIDSTERGNDKVLREKHFYQFRKGQPTQLELYYYYDDRQVGRKRIAFGRESMVNGFKNIRIEHDSGAVTDRELLEAGFQIHKLMKIEKRYITFKERKSGRMLYFMIDRSYWGPLSIDSILSPGANDRIVLGTSKHPKKNYRVENMIKEKDVTEYTYHPYLKRIERIIMNDFPFITTRTFSYDKLGYCKSYIDSTFSSGEFLMRSVSNIKLNNKKYPVSISHIKETAFKKLGLVSVERFKYR